MRRIIMALMVASLVAFAVAAWVLVAPTPAKAAYPGQNGRIVFHRQDSDGFMQTWVADKDLKVQVQVTSGSAESGWAVWKPGGAKLAFDSCVEREILRSPYAGCRIVPLAGYPIVGLRLLGSSRSTTICCTCA